MPPEGQLSSPNPAVSGSFDFWIEAGQTEKNYWRDIWRYRELVFILVWRDISVRYKQTVVGTAWTLVQPLLAMIIMTVVFRKVAGLPSVGQAPYPIMVFAAVLPWQFFANALSNAGQSIVGSANMISKVYFPRVIVPLASVFVALADFAVSFLILGALMVGFEFLPTWRILTLPFFIAIGILAAVGPGLLLTALTVRYRDFRIIIPFIMQLGMFISPVGYSSDLVRQKFGEGLYLLYCLNPLVGVIEGFRWAILGGETRFFNAGTVLSLFVVALLLVAGISYFRKTERTFADIV